MTTHDFVDLGGGGDKIAGAPVGSPREQRGRDYREERGSRQRTAQNLSTRRTEHVAPSLPGCVPQRMQHRREGRRYSSRQRCVRKRARRRDLGDATARTA